MRKLVRPSRRSKTVPMYLSTTPVSTVPVPIGMLKAIVEKCEMHLSYGDNKAAKAKRDRADAADFYRRAAELAMAELNAIINQKEN